MSGVSAHEGPERPLYEAVEVKPGLPWRPKMLDMSEPWDKSISSFRVSCYNFSEQKNRRDLGEEHGKL